MFGNPEGKPVNIIITEHTYIEGKLVEQGTKLKDVPADLAMELAAAGKAKLYTPPAKAEPAKA